MSSKKKNIKHGYLWGVFNLKCSRCREGDMFRQKSSYKLKGLMSMNEHCAVCGQRLELETGFYYGTGYVSYALAVALSVTSLVAWWIIIGLSLNDNRFFWWMGFNACLLVILQPFLMRFSRAIWLSFFVKYDPDFESN